MTNTNDTWRRNDNRWGLLGSAIRTRMATLGLNRRTLAKRAGVSPSTITHITSGNRKDHRPQTLMRVAEGLKWHPLAAVAVLADDQTAAELGIELTDERAHRDPPNIRQNDP